MSELQMSELQRMRWVVDEMRVETPSWGFAASGTRFGIFRQPGAPRDVFEKIEDAGLVARYTGVARAVAIHIPWDATDDFAALAAYAQEHGVSIGGINSNTFQDEAYRLGSVCHPDAAVRRKAIDHIVECCDIARQTGSSVVKVWLADGTNYPGQDDLRRRRHRLIEGLSEAHAALPQGVRMLLEYKLFEPAFYSTDVQDWGQSLSVCRRVGDRAQVCVDLGHHALGVNIEQIVAALLAEGALGGFDLNDKKYGDDDLMVGSIDPYQLFRICHELVSAREDEDDPVAAACARDLVLMLDQSHNIEDKVPAMIRSVMQLQESFAKALLVDRSALRSAQDSGEVLEANAILRDAFDHDVRPLVAEARTTVGLPGDPYRAYLESGNDAARAEARQGGIAAGWG